MLINLFFCVLFFLLPVRAWGQACALREVPRLADQAFVVCQTRGTVPITREQYATVPLSELCGDGTGHPVAFIAPQYATPSRQPEACDVFDASNAEHTKHLKHLRLPDGRDVDIDTRTHRPQRDGQGRLSGFTPPLPGVVVTGPRTTRLSLWPRLLALLLPSSLHAAVAFDQSQSADTGTALVTDISYSATVADQPNRALYVGLCTANGTSDETTADTFNGVDMALVARVHSIAPDIANAYLFRLTNPAATTANVAFTLGTGRRASTGTLSLYGVDQTTPEDAAQTNANNDDTAEVTVNVTTATGDMIVDVGCARRSDLTFAMGAQPNRTSRWSDVTTNATASNNIHGGGSTRTGTGALAMNWTLSANNGMAMVGVNVNQAPTTPASLSLGFKLLR